MPKLSFIFFFFLIISDEKLTLSKQENPMLKKLCEAYPDHLISCEGNTVTWKDGTKMVFDDGKTKDFQALLDSPDLEDQLKTPYPKGTSYELPRKGEDAGRVRYEPFFMKMYGNSAQEVSKKLTTVIWLPRTLNLKIKVTTVNEVHKKMEAISAELDEKPHLRKYLEKPAGTFAWRTITGTNRLSTHSFGMTIDINVTYSNYWQWDSKTTKEDLDLGYKNAIPSEIITVFEKYGFIWGGKWYHYDTMHFEYRPELLN